MTQTIATVGPHCKALVAALRRRQPLPFPQAEFMAIVAQILQEDGWTVQLGVDVAASATARRGKIPMVAWKAGHVMAIACDREGPPPRVLKQLHNFPCTEAVVLLRRLGQDRSLGRTLIAHFQVVR